MAAILAFAQSINIINITFIRKYTPCSLSTELRALKYITVINLSISKIIKFITDIKTIKERRENPPTLEKLEIHLFKEDD